MVNGFYITIPVLGANLFFLTILSICIIYEIHRSKSCSQKKNYRRRRRNNDQTKITIIIITLFMLITANIGCAADLVHVTFCYLASNVQHCTSEFDIERLIADISYWIAYISLYFIIVSRLYVTFINTKYRLSPCIIFILILLMFICYMACLSMLTLGYFKFS